MMDWCLSGTTALHIELEDVVADFVGKPVAMVTGMGYVTNSAILPVLVRHVRVLVLSLFVQKFIILDGNLCREV